MGETHQSYSHIAILILTVTLLLMPAAGMTATATAPIRIVLSPDATVDEDVITLGTVADIQGLDGAALERLQAVEVGRSPLPGQSLLVHRGQIEMRLKQNDMDPARFDIRDSGPVKVLRNHHGVTAERIVEAVRSHIETHAPWSAEQMTLRPIRYHQDHRVPPGRVTFQVNAPKHVNWLGAVPFRVNILVDGQVAQRVSVPTYIEVWQEVVLAAKPLGRNQPITAADVKTERMNLARVPSSAVFDPQDVLGQRTSRPLAANSVLRSDHIHQPPVIRRGDVVQVVVESERLRITTQAVAQENGGVGETIRLLNARSRKDIHARVVDGQTVEIAY